MTMPTPVLDAIANLKYVIHLHMGAVETTDLAVAWKRLEDAINPPPPTPAELPADVPGPGAA